MQARAVASLRLKRLDNTLVSLLISIPWNSITRVLVLYLQYTTLEWYKKVITKFSCHDPIKVVQTRDRNDQGPSMCWSPCGSPWTVFGLGRWGSACKFSSGRDSNPCGGTHNKIFFTFQQLPISTCVSSTAHTNWISILDTELSPFLK